MLIQAKGIQYDSQSLLKNKEDALLFNNGQFVTLYLSPKDYHRIHMPVAGKLIKTTYVPGSLFSVNPLTAESVPGLFARNERVISLFKTSFGTMAIIMVGAVIVASINTSWAGKITPNKNRKLQTWNYETQDIKYLVGEKIGHFELGSTVIILFEPNAINWNQELEANAPLKMGQKIAEVIARE